MASSTTTGDGTPPVNRHALTAVERQRAQLARLLKDPAKPAPVPAPPKEKTIRPPREMMKNVQGSSAGAGSGEFHVYKANRRREYERLKLMEETSKQEAEVAEFDARRRERDEKAEARTSKNRAKRMKRKERAQGKGKGAEAGPAQDGAGGEGAVKKRRLLGGSELVFRPPGADSDEERAADEADEAAAAGEVPAEAVSAQVLIHDAD